MKEAQKVKAAIAAVTHYIQTEEAAIVQALQNRGLNAAAKPAPPAGAISMWRISGRQTQMQMRNMMQLKTLR